MCFKLAGHLVLLLADLTEEGPQDVGDVAADTLLLGSLGLAPQPEFLRLFQFRLEQPSARGRLVQHLSVLLCFADAEHVVLRHKRDGVPPSYSRIDTA